MIQSPDRTSHGTYRINLRTAALCDQIYLRCKEYRANLPVITRLNLELLTLKQSLFDDLTLRRSFWTRANLLQQIGAVEEAAACLETIRHLKETSSC